MSAEFTYICEKCSGEVTMTIIQYHRLKFGKWGARIICDVCNPKKVEAEEMVPTNRQPRRVTVPRQRHLPPPTLSLELRPGERSDYGVTVTVREQTSREMDVLVGNGPVMSALMQVCDSIDGRPGCWRVVSVSSPATIFADLQGARDPDTTRPETVMLAKVGRLDLIEDAARAAA